MMPALSALADSLGMGDAVAAGRDRFQQTSDEERTRVNRGIRAWMAGDGSFEKLSLADQQAATAALGAGIVTVGIAPGSVVGGIVGHVVGRPIADMILGAPRIGSGLKADSSHRAASFATAEQLMTGKVFELVGGDGVKRTLLQTKAEYNGKSGIFEYIFQSGKGVTHQRFIEGGVINGAPNQRVKP